MKLCIAIVFFLGLTMVFSDAADDKYNILTPEGKYKSGNYSIWFLIRIHELLIEKKTDWLKEISKVVIPTFITIFCSGGMTMWKPIMEQMKPFSDPSGDKLIDDLIDMIGPADRAATNSNMQSLSQIWSRVSIILLQLVRHIENEELKKVIFHRALASADLSVNMAFGGSIKQFGSHNKVAMIEITAAMA